MKWDQIKNIFQKEPAFRWRQIYRALLFNAIGSWEEATFLSLAVRKELSEKAPLEIEAEIRESADGQSAKALITLADGQKVETALMRNRKGRNTVCVSSQAGCAMGCVFCATGKLGSGRNLSAEEILEQVMYFVRYLRNKKAFVDNVVFMGMGEPLMNYDEVMRTVGILHDQQIMNLGARHLSISTAGIVPAINRLAAEKIPVNLAVSLNAADEETRTKLMPINKKYPLRQVMEAVASYQEKTRRKVMFEYVMIKGINDAVKDAEALSEMVAGKDCVVNLIACNAVGDYPAPDEATIEVFKKVLQNKKIRTTQRYSFGGDIEAACGQLAGKKS